ncbi:hypothetical protein V8E54_008742 [Elaphomyces granulatus]
MSDLTNSDDEPSDGPTRTPKRPSLIDPVALHFIKSLQEGDPIRNVVTEADARARADNNDDPTADRPAPPHLPLLDVGGASRASFPGMSTALAVLSRDRGSDVPSRSSRGVAQIQFPPESVDDEATSQLPKTDVLKEKERSRRKARQPTYSLFPEPIDRELYLDDTSTASARDIGPAASRQDNLIPPPCLMT